MNELVNIPNEVLPLDALVQLSQLGQVARLRKLEESKVPVGTKSVELTVTDTVLDYVIYDDALPNPGFPWISFALVNKGPDRVKVDVNSTFDLVRGSYIDVNGELFVNMVYPIIYRLYLQAETGGTAVVDIRGKMGIRVHM